MRSQHWASPCPLIGDVYAGPPGLKGSSVPKYRLTLNLSIDGVDEEGFEEYAGVVLDELLEREAKGLFAKSRVDGRLDVMGLRLSIEFSSRGFNSAYLEGVGKFADALEVTGADISSWREGPHKAVTGDYPGDDYDAKLEEIPFKHGSRDGHMRVTNGSLELVGA